MLLICAAAYSLIRRVRWRGSFGIDGRIFRAVAGPRRIAVATPPRSIWSSVFCSVQSRAGVAMRTFALCHSSIRKGGKKWWCTSIRCGLAAGCVLCPDRRRNTVGHAPTPRPTEQQPPRTAAARSAVQSWPPNNTVSAATASHRILGTYGPRRSAHVIALPVRSPCRRRRDRGVVRHGRRGRRHWEAAPGAIAVTRGAMRRQRDRSGDRLTGGGRRRHLRRGRRRLSRGEGDCAAAARRCGRCEAPPRRVAPMATAHRLGSVGRANCRRRQLDGGAGRACCMVRRGLDDGWRLVG